jgi:hypothetical protein
MLFFINNKNNSFFSLHFKVKSKDNYGITQNPDTKDYIIVFNCNKYYCEKCERYIDKWCKSCQINHLKNDFISWSIKN